MRQGFLNTTLYIIYTFINFILFYFCLIVLINIFSVVNISNKKPILITGSHRSGSTWTGRMIAHSPAVALIEEPFNLNNHNIWLSKLEYWFQYVYNENEEKFLDEFGDCLQFRFPLLRSVRANPSLKNFIKISYNYFYTAKYKLLMKRPLVKDPLAIFSTAWLEKQFNMSVIVLIRHPAAFAGSLKIANWVHPFNHFLRQPQLIEHHLLKYKQEIEKFSGTTQNIIDQAILLWNLIHHMIINYKYTKPNWIFIKHETLSRNPILEFGRLYKKLDLQYSKRIQQKIKQFSFVRPHKNNNNNIIRNSQSNIFSWKDRLTTDEVIRIKEGTHEIASQFYSEQDWHELFK